MDDRADLGKAQAARVAVEQTGAERLLSPGPRQPQFARGDGKAVMGDDLDEDRHAGEAVQ